MSTDRLNLLPDDRRRALRRAYRFRLATIACIHLIILTCIASALLTPTYLYLLSAERSQNARLAQVESTLSSADEAALAKRLSALEANAAVISALATTSSAGQIVREVLTVPRQGVVLATMSYAASGESKPGSIALSGTAATRNELRAYQLALLGASGFAGADLPVSSYAKDRDIPFTILVTLATSTTP